MKIGTDAVMLGAWMDVGGRTRALDIGTGCGVIALLAAQRMAQYGADFEITAIDIDGAAAGEAVDNFASSPWASHLEGLHLSLEEFLSKTPDPAYDLIFSNPPYYQDTITSGNERRDIARGGMTLPHTEILDAAMKLLRPEGVLAVVLPLGEGKSFLLEALGKGLHLRRQCYVKTKETKPARRLMLELSPASAGQVLTETLVIGSEGWERLTEPYYPNRK